MMWMSSSSLGWTAMPVRSGPIFVPSPLCVWHLRALLLEDRLAGGGVAGLLGERQQLVDDLLPVGVRQAAALREERLRPARRSPGPGCAARACF